MGAKPYDFDPFKLTGVKVAKKNRAEALEAAANFVKEKILDNTGAGRTSVSGGRWVRSLTPAYKKVKSEESSADFANLELHGDMLDSLDVDISPRSKNQLRIQVDADQADKAEGHLTGQYGKNSRTRPRQFMPQGEQELSADIVRGVKQVLKRFEEEE